VRIECGPGEYRATIDHVVGDRHAPWCAHPNLALALERLRQEAEAIAAGTGRQRPSIERRRRTMNRRERAEDRAFRTRIAAGVRPWPLESPPPVPAKTGARPRPRYLRYHLEDRDPELSALVANFRREEANPPHWQVLPVSWPRVWRNNLWAKPPMWSDSHA
jgi:hypothetical protein